MRLAKKCLQLILILILSSRLSAQTTQENSGWFAWFNTYRLSHRWGLYFDGQVRSADNWSYVRNLLLRPGVTYFFDSKNNITVGYAYIGSYNRLPEPSKNSLSEHRIWEQYIYLTKIGRVSLQNRFRLEQRFIERQTENLFSQRLRYFVRAIIPLQKQNGPFSEGLFAALQNEIFLNVQNKDDINGSVFDQNRIYGAVGFRFNPKLDLEVGYMNQYTNGSSNDVSNNIIQMALYTRF